MLRMAQIDYIKDLYENEDLSLREISRRTGHSFQTVQKYAYQENWIKEKLPNLEAENYPNLEKYIPSIDEWMELDRKLPRKQRHTAMRIYHRLVDKLTALNSVPPEPVIPRVLGPKMCVPFGKILRGNAVPNTVTKTIHTDKVFSPDLQSFTIQAFPGYAPLESQIRTVRSFRRPVMLVDDLLHSGNRIQALDPLLRREGVDVDCCVVGLLSGRGRDLMAARGREVDSVYFIPNMRAWFVESTMYPFIGGDAVGGARASVPGLTPAVNLILPYAFPKFYKECGREAVFAFSRTCLENSRALLLALEAAYRERYARNLTLSRLSEAVILPLSPDKGDCLRYDASQSASMCLENDLKLLLRMRELLE